MAIAAFYGDCLDVQGRICPGRVQDAAGGRSRWPSHGQSGSEPYARPNPCEFVSVHDEPDGALLLRWRNDPGAGFHLGGGTVLASADYLPGATVVLRFNP